MFVRSVGVGDRLGEESYVAPSTWFPLLLSRMLV